MIEQEAIKILKCSKKKFTVLESEINRNAAIDIAIKSLEKQIAKKTTSTYCENYGEEVYKCPNCKGLVDYKQHHCICGQRLDWSDEE